MPEVWQKSFVKHLNELNNTIDWNEDSLSYQVTLRDSKGRFVKDPYSEYRRPVQMKFKGV